MENSRKTPKTPSESTTKYAQSDLEELYSSLTNEPFLEGDDPVLKGLTEFMRQGTYRLEVQDLYFMPSGRLMVGLSVSLKAGRAGE